jgi:HlyD family secretion protein
MKVHRAVSLITLILALSGLRCSGNDDGKISASGTIEATEIRISSKVGAEIISLRVDEGSDVKKGDTLVILDHADLDIQMKQADANVAAATAQWKLAVNGARKEDIIQAEATLVSARDDWNRIQKLFETESATQKQFDDAKTRLTLAEQTYNKLKDGSRAEEIEAARARRDQAIAQADAVRKKIADSYVLSPVNGTITGKTVEEGEAVLPNASLLTITQLDKIYLMIYITEKELTKVRLGQQVHIVVDGAPDKPVAGMVTYISPTAEFTPRNIQTKEERTKLVFGVKVEADNTNRLLKVGMPADAVIELQEHTSSQK